MKTMTEVHFFGDRIPGGASSVLEPARCGPEVVESIVSSILGQSISVVLRDDDERLKILLTLLEQYGQDPTIIRNDLYTDEELANARLIYLYGNTSHEVDGELGWDTTFDLTGTCPGCRSGARQTAPYLMPAEELPRLEGHRMVLSYWDHILVDDRLADALVATGATGLAFHSVYAFTKEKRQMKLRWKQLVAPHVLPAMSAESTGLIRERPCALCHRSGYCRQQAHPPRIAYRAADLVNALDVNSTWEGFGFATIKDDGKPSKLSVPGILVTPKVWRVFRDAGVTEVDFLPIRVVED